MLLFGRNEEQGPPLRRRPNKNKPRRRLTPLPPPSTTIPLANKRKKKRQTNPERHTKAASIHTHAARIQIVYGNGTQRRRERRIPLSQLHSLPSTRTKWEDTTWLWWTPVRAPEPDQLTKVELPPPHSTVIYLFYFSSSQSLFSPFTPVCRHYRVKKKYIIARCARNTAQARRNRK